MAFKAIPPWESAQRPAQTPSQQSAPPTPTPIQQSASPLVARAKTVPLPHQLSPTPAPLPLALPGSFWIENASLTPELQALFESGGFAKKDVSRHEEGDVMHTFHIFAAEGCEGEDSNTDLLRVFKSPAVVRFFEELDQERDRFAVMVIAGDTRVGKSTLLNEILAIFGQAPAFGTSHLKNVACTAGLWFVPKLLQMKSGRKVLLVDMEGLGAIGGNSRSNRAYFEKLFVSAFFLAQSLTFLMRTASVNETVFERLRLLASHAHRFLLDESSRNTLHSNTPDVFALIAQDWPFRSVQDDQGTWKQTADKAPRDLVELWDSTASFSTGFRFFSMPQLEDPKRSEKIDLIIRAIMDNIRCASFSTAADGDPQEMSPAAFLSVASTVIESVNKSGAMPDPESFVDKLRNEARQKAFVSVLRCSSEALSNSLSSFQTPVTPQQLDSMIFEVLGTGPAYVVKTQAPKEGDTAAWTVEGVFEMLCAELKKLETVEKMKSSVLQSCETSKRSLLEQLLQKRILSQEEWDLAVRNQEAELRALFGHFEPWTTPFLDSFSADAAKLFAEFHGKVEAAMNKAMAQIGGIYFALHGSILPECPIREIFEVLRGYVIHKFDTISFDQLRPPFIDMQALESDFRRSVEGAPEFLVLQANFSGTMNKLITMLNTVLLRVAEFFCRKIRHLVTYQFMVPEFVQTENYTVSEDIVQTPESLIGLVSPEYVLANTPRHCIDLVLTKKLKAAKDLFDHLVDARKIDRNYHMIANLLPELRSVAAMIRQMVPLPGAMLDLRMNCKAEETNWVEALEAALGSGHFSQTLRGSERVGEKNTTWFTLVLSSPELRERFLPIISKVLHDFEARVVPHVPCHAFICTDLVHTALSQRQPGGKDDFDHVLEGIRRLVCLQCGVLSLGSECFPLNDGNHIITLALASKEDLQVVCSEQLSIFGRMLSFSPCPIVIVGNQDTSEVFNIARDAGFLPIAADPHGGDESSPPGVALTIAFDAPAQYLVTNAANLFGPGVFVQALQQASISKKPQEAEPANPLEDRRYIESKLWPDRIFNELLYRIKDASHIDIHTASLAWDPAVWRKHFSWFFGRKSEAPHIDPKLCSLRIYVAGSTLRFVSDNGHELDGFIEQVVREPGPDPNTPGRILRLERISAPNPRCFGARKYDHIPQFPKAELASTEVRVVNMDALEVAKQCQIKFPGAKVCLLNLANQSTPGGRWMQGILAQEENLFLRTTLLASLDRRLYKLGEFSCIYSEGVAVIREPESGNFAFLPEDAQWRLDIISATAYNLATGSLQPFTAELASKTRAKIEQILSVCAQNKCEVLVLGALGCGAFRNPPRHIAAIFRALIQQYAGVFPRIYFAILDESGLKVRDFALELVDPTGAVLQGLVPQANSIENVEGIVTAYNKWEGGNFAPTDVSKPICPFAGGCREIQELHFHQYQHPPFCQFGDKCNDRSDFHRQLFMHRNRCPDFSSCPIMLGADPNRIREHSKRFIHAEMCPQGGKCKSTDPGHCAQFMHLPLCAQALHCPLLEIDQAHANSFRHIAEECFDGTFCPRFNDPEHVKTCSHPFITPCPRAPFDCRDTTPDHLNSFSHVCPDGPICSKLNDPGHLRLFFHAGAVCSDPNCSDLSETHLSSYFHPGVTPFRPRCRNSWCTNSDPGHLREFSHPFPSLALSPVEQHNSRDPGGDVAAYGNFDPDIRVPFFSNVLGWIEKTDTYLKANGGLDEAGAEYRKIVAFFESLRPLHMCSATVFASMIKLGIAASLAQLSTMWSEVKDICASVLLRDEVKVIVDANGNIAKKIGKYIRTTARIKQGEISKGKIVELSAKLTGSETDKVAAALTVFQRTPEVLDSEKRKQREMRISFASVQSIGEDGLKKIDAAVEDVVNALSHLVENSPGIGYSVDREVRTNYTVFSVVGPHWGSYGGRECILVMRAVSMHHPDFYMLPNSATGFHQGWYHQNGTELQRQAWMGPGKPWGGGGKKDLTLEKINPMVPRFAEALAKEWVCRIQVKLGKAPDAVTLDDVLAHWREIDSHYVTEGHLASTVPLDYVEHVILTKSAYKKLQTDPVAKATLDRWRRHFGDDYIKVVDTSDALMERGASYLREVPVRHRPSGLSFVLSSGAQETFVPQKIPPDFDSAHIYFVARGSNLFVTISSTGDLADPKHERKMLTFFVDRSGNVSAFTAAPGIARAGAAVAEFRDFNRSCPTEYGVHYHIYVDNTAREIVFQHWGPSRVYNNSALSVPLTAPEPLSHVSFASDGTKPEIWDFVIAKTPRPIPMLFRPVQRPKPVPQPTPATQIQFTTTRLPHCSEPFTCKIAANEKSPQWLAHVSTVSHVCRFGRFCNKLSDPQHMACFVHMRKPLCSLGSQCPHLSSAQHRFEFSHQGLWDFLLPCKDGAMCQFQGDHNHCSRFHHEHFTFPAPKSH